MDVIVELVIEFLFEILFEGTIELLPNIKLPKWFRFPLGILLVLVFLAVIVLVIYTGYICLEKTILGGVAIIVIGVMLLIGGSVKFFKHWDAYKSEK